MCPRKAILRLSVILLVASALLGINPNPVSSAEITPEGYIIVDSFLDIDDNAGNSVCSAGHPTDGPCTLRAAIYEANQNVLSKNIVIKLPAGVYNLTIPPVSAYSDNQSGDLNINFVGPSPLYNITIEPLNGGQVIIQSNIDDRILSIGLNAKVFIKNITMQDGSVGITESVQEKGGGAIHNEGILDLNGVSLLNNKVRCSISGSCSSSPYIFGGAVYNNGTLSLTDSTLDGNEAARGSAIFNTAGGTGGGKLTILYSTISNNVNWGSATIINYSDMTILNSTFSGNSSNNPNSAINGIENNSTLRMQSSTMANKGANGGIMNSASPVGTVYIKDNIFKAESGKSNCYIYAGSNWTSGGYNIANDNSCQLTATGDLSSVDPLLGSFGNWGGPTKTIMLNPGSPALDHRPGHCWMAVNFIPDDQRHWPRDDGQCDTGAYEYSPFMLYLPFIKK